MLYICFVILALMKRTGVYSVLNLRRIRNRLILFDIGFILGTLAIVKLEYMSLGFTLFTVILGSAFAIGYFLVEYRKYLNNVLYTPHGMNKLFEIWHKKFRLITVIVIVIGSILHAFVYAKFKETYQEYGNYLLPFCALFALSGTTLYLILVIIAEKKYGPIYYNRDKKSHS